MHLEVHYYPMHSSPSGLYPAGTLQTSLGRGPSTESSAPPNGMCMIWCYTCTRSESRVRCGAEHMAFTSKSVAGFSQTEWPIGQSMTWHLLLLCGCTFLLLPGFVSLDGL